MHTKYDYDTKYDLDTAEDVQTALRFSVLNYMHHTLGWSLERSEARVEKKLNRVIPKGNLDTVKRRGWNIKGAKLLDVGAGQGGVVLEALIRGADAYGVEPGEEFSDVARMRLEEADFDGKRISTAYAESLPFPDNHFDYAISLRVLEHVADPFPVLQEIFRVLKPGGSCYIACENYLSFREQHYRVPWLPLLPKPLGGLYLRAIGRDPAFLNKYVFYTTYPQIWRMAKRAGFINETHRPTLEKINAPERIHTFFGRVSARLLRALPAFVARAVVNSALHLRRVFTPGVKVFLAKPQTRKG